MTVAARRSVIVAPNAFRDGPRSAWVAAALAAGVVDALEPVDVVQLPLADGGDGSLPVAMDALHLDPVEVDVTGPDGRTLSAYYGRRGTEAYIEMAVASGLAYFPATADPLDATTAGTGELIRHALEHGARHLVVGAGGAPGLDLGAGALAALGVTFVDRAGNPLPAVPRHLAATVAADVSGLHPLIGEASITVVADVRTSVSRNLTVFGPQKRISGERAAALRAAAIAVAAALEALPGRPPASHALDGPHLGAGGGMAAGLHAGVGAEVVAGARWFIERSPLPSLIGRCDLVLTAEGCFDSSSGEGKLPYEVLQMAAGAGKDAVLVAGAVRDPALARPARVVELGPPLEPTAGSATFHHIRASVAAALSRTTP